MKYRTGHSKKELKEIMASVEAGTMSQETAEKLIAEIMEPVEEGSGGGCRY